MKEFLAIIAGTTEGLAVWSFVGWTVTRRTPAGRKYRFFSFIFFLAGILAGIFCLHTVPR
jgi:hypothetical protein